MFEKWVNNLGSKTFLLVIVATGLVILKVITENTWSWIVGLWIAKEGAVKFVPNQRGDLPQ